MRPYLHSIICLLIAPVSSTFALQQVQVSGSHPGAITLNSVQFQAGGPLYTEFAGPVAVTGFTFSSSPSEFGVRNGETITPYTSYPTHSAFLSALTATFADTNLNSYFDVSVPAASTTWSLTVDFGTTLFDDNSGTDGNGELLITERGFGPSGPGNSLWRVTPVDSLGAAIGTTYVIDSNFNIALSPPTNVVFGQPLGVQTIDLSSAFGTNEVRYLRFENPAPGTVGAGQDAYPDFQVYSVETVPEPAGICLISIACGLVMIRRERKGVQK